MVSLGTFIGIPDWRSAVLAALFSAPWALLLGWQWLRGSRRHLLTALGAALLAAVLFAPSIAWIQVPLQSALGALWLNLLGGSLIQRLLLLVAIPSILLTGVVQEGAKFLISVLGLRSLPEGRDARAALALGAAVGAGYGGFEAFWVFNRIAAVGFSWGTVQLNGPLALLPIFERFVTVPFHIGAAALAAYGYGTGRPWRFLALAMGLHALANYGALMLSAGALNALTTELWVTVVSVFTICGALWLRRRLAPQLVTMSMRVSSNDTPGA